MQLQSIRAWMLAFALTSLCERGFASDWYVDAVNGNNANSGTNPSTAWRTITHAIASTPATGVQTIHVAAGIYGTALGEVFPYFMRPQLQVIGESRSTTHVVAPGGVAIFTLNSSVYGAGYNFPPDTRIASLHLTGGAQGIAMSSDWGPVSPTLTDLEIEQCSSIGITVGVNSQFAGSAAPVLQSIDIHHCGFGLGVGDMTTVTVRDSTIHENTSHGVVAGSGWGLSQPIFQRCRIERNGGHGVYTYISNYGGVAAAFDDCSVSLNAQCGWYSAPSAGLGGSYAGTFKRSTIANNGTIGIFNYLGLVTLTTSVVWGNADDIDAAVSATNCDVGEPVPGSGNFMSDPLFENAVGGDFRLRFGSPCIDAVTVPTGGTLDLAGHTRNVDGDLNTTEVADLGALEFQPLAFVGTAQLGTLMTLELRGPQGATSTLYWTRGALAANPMSTPFGQLDLQPSLAHVYRVVTVGSVVPAIVQRSIPNAPFLVGQTFAFQALTDNPAAPAGKAYTNAVQFTISP